jgi:hypothetical protein
VRRGGAAGQLGLQDHNLQGDVVDTGDVSHITKRDRRGNSGVGGRTGCASGKG